MEPDKTFHDVDYKRTCAAIGWALLLFVVIFAVLGVLAELLSEALAEQMFYKWHYTLTEVINMVVYLSSFLIPTFVLRLSLKRRHIFTPPSYSIDGVTSVSLLLIPATIGVCIFAAYINTIAMSFFGVSEAYDSLIGFEGMYEGYQIALLYVSSALVPAFCEELLFRGTILANLIPYGKHKAVIISSVMFGLMHQNPYQILYTTVIGIMLGMAYIKTRSIWLPTIIHFINNAYSATNQVIYANFEPAFANSILIVSRFLVIVLGVAALVFYLVIENKRAVRRFDDGFFGREIELNAEYSEKPISEGYAAKGFFRASTVIYIVVTVLSMISLIAVLLMRTYNGLGAV